MKTKEEMLKEAAIYAGSIVKSHYNYIGSFNKHKPKLYYTIIENSYKPNTIGLEFFMTVDKHTPRLTCTITIDAVEGRVIEYTHARDTKKVPISNTTLVDCARYLLTTAPGPYITIEQYKVIEEIVSSSIIPVENIEVNDFGNIQFNITTYITPCKSVKKEILIIFEKIKEKDTALVITKILPWRGKQVEETLEEEMKLDEVMRYLTVMFYKECYPSG